ncbi:ankyrin repeat-containing domain protein, partial [Peziza echinospora]
MRTALHTSAAKGHFEDVRNLLAHGADVNACDYHSVTPLHLACLQGHADVVTLLLEHGAD